MARERTTAEITTESSIKARINSTINEAELDAVLDPTSRRQLEWQQRIFSHLPKCIDCFSSPPTPPALTTASTELTSVLEVAAAATALSRGPEIVEESSRPKLSWVRDSKTIRRDIMKVKINARGWQELRWLRGNSAPLVGRCCDG